MSLRSLIAAFACLISLGCGSDPVQNAPPPPFTTGSGVSILPVVVELEPGGTRALQVKVLDDDGRIVNAPAVEWNTTDGAVASVTSAGVVTALTIGNARIVARSNGAADTAEIRVIPAAPATPVVVVYPGLTYQEMLGWEGTAQIGEVECNPQAFAVYRAEVIDRLVNELGINRVRMHVRSGHENPQDHYTTYRNSHQPSDWYPYRSQAINDNEDPQSARAGGFQFAEIDHKVDVIIAPMRAALAARGERLYVNLNYVDFGVSPWEQSTDPQEYAELILQVFLHLQQRYGWVPDAVEVSLEPDNTPNWRPGTIGAALVAAGDRLKAAGFTPAFIAPSNTNMSSALSYLEEMVTIPRVLEYLTDIAYHRYAGVSDQTLATIAARAREYGLRTAMLEHIGSGHEHLHDDILDGLNSSWQQFTLAYCDPDDRGSAYYRIDDTIPSSPRVILASRSRYLRQYFAFVRFKAMRIGAVSGDAYVAPLAFRNTNGKHVIVARVGRPTNIPLRGVPAGTWSVTYTSATQTFVSLPDIVVPATGTVQVSMPAIGVITLNQR